MTMQADTEVKASPDRVFDAMADTFEAKGGGTHIHADWDFRPKGIFKLLFPVMKGMIRKDMAKQMASFASFVESRA